MANLSANRSSFVRCPTFDASGTPELLLAPYSSGPSSIGRLSSASKSLVRPTTGPKSRAFPSSSSSFHHFSFMFMHFDPFFITFPIVFRSFSTRRRPAPSLELPQLLLQVVHLATRKATRHGLRPASAREPHAVPRLRRWLKRHHLRSMQYYGIYSRYPSINMCQILSIYRTYIWSRSAGPTPHPPPKGLGAQVFVCRGDKWSSPRPPCGLGGRVCMYMHVWMYVCICM